MKISKISIFAILTSMLLSACSAEEKMAPVKDAEPASTVYTYTPGEEYNADNDVRVRIVPNSQVNEVYYLVESADQIAEFKEKNGEAAYADHVISDGTKINVKDGNLDFVIRDLYGQYYITVVSVGNGKRGVNQGEFFGLSWDDITTGTYQFALSAKLGVTTASTTLQICTSDETLYRFKDLFGAGKSLKIVLMPEYKATDDDGEYTFFRVPSQKTGLIYGDYGEIGVRDVGYWQNDDAYVTEYEYESGMYADYSCFICVQYFVSAGNLGLAYYDLFSPTQNN